MGIRRDGTVESALRGWTGRDGGRRGAGGTTLLLTPRGTGRNRRDRRFRLVVGGRHCGCNRADTELILG